MPRWWHREIRLGDVGRDVAIVNRKLAIPGDIYLPETAARIRGLQHMAKIEKSGTVNKETADRLGEPASEGQVPEWYRRELYLWTEGEDVRALRKSLGMKDNDNRFDPDVEKRVRQWQSENKVEPDGWVREDMAKQLGD